MTFFDFCKIQVPGPVKGISDGTNMGLDHILTIEKSEKSSLIQFHV